MVCVLCVCHLRIFFSPTVTLSLHCRYTTGVTSVTMIRAKLIEAEPVHFATAESTPVSCACINSLVFSLRSTRLKGFGEQTQRDCRRVRSRWHTSAVTQPRTKILAASRDILSLRLCVCVCVYRANHCPSASADPACLARARNFPSTRLVRLAYTLPEFPRRGGVPPEERILFLPRANWPTSGDKVGRKTVSVDIEPRRHRRPVRSSHRARRVHLDQGRSTNFERGRVQAILKDVERIRRRRWLVGGS